MKYLVTIIAILAFDRCLAEKVRYDNYKVFRLTPKDDEALSTLKSLEDVEISEYNFWSSATIVGANVDLLVPPNRVQVIQNMSRSLNMESTILMENVQEHIDKEDLRPEGRAGGYGWNHYHSVEEIYDWLRHLARIYPNVVTLIQGGVSYEGRPILGVKVSYSRANENNAVFIESLIHAREWITAAVSTYILNELLTGHDPVVRRLAERHDWYVFPIFNPDGYVFSYTSNRMWRKTRTPYSVLCFGADPNRNWGYHWNSGGSSALACSDTYRGPSAFSETSVRTMANFINSVGHKLVGYISFHSYSQLLLLPYGYTSQHLENYALTYAIGLKSAQALSQRFGTRYTVGNIVETLYVASGGSMDWVKGTFKTPIAYTYELRDTGRHGFLLPPEDIIPTALETMDSFVTIFEEYRKTL